METAESLSVECSLHGGCRDEVGGHLRIDVI